LRNHRDPSRVAEGPGEQSVVGLLAAGGPARRRPSWRRSCRSSELHGGGRAGQGRSSWDSDRCERAENASVDNVCVIKGLQEMWSFTLKRTGNQVDPNIGCTILGVDHPAVVQYEGRIVVEGLQ
jgi:hypothetical protein